MDKIIPCKKKLVSSPALVLLFLSPIIGKLLSSSAPPAEFFNPIGFIFLVILYGGGAILARELTHRWNKGWLTLLILGAAYGIAEEGLICKSFFDPHWEDLGALEYYGRWFGVNFVWSVGLIIYHAVFSIGIAVLLVNLIFPKTRSEEWISKKAFNFLAGLWIINGLFIFWFISAYRPPILHYSLTLCIVIGLVVLAKRLPFSPAVVDKDKICHPFLLWLTGFLSTISLFFLLWASPHLEIHPLINIFSMFGLVILVLLLILKVLGDAVLWSEKHQLSLSAGALSFFIFLSPIQEFDKARVDNTMGMTLVGVAAFVFLLWLNWVVKTRNI